MSVVLTPILSATAGTSQAYNEGIAEAYSWVPTVGEALGRPMYAKASYITNFSDLQVSLSASEVNIGSVHISDASSGVTADVVAIPDYGNGLQVLTQDLESSIDDITIGDKQGHYADVDPVLSALNVKIVNSNVIGVSGNVTVINPVTSVQTTPAPVQLDAFARLRISNPVTLFDSSHRYRDNNLWSSLTAVGGSRVFNANQGLIDLTVNTTQDSEIIRETTKVFSYQPGKSILILNSFVMEEGKSGLRQRVGYYGANNGMYLELSGSSLSFVKRSSITGSVVDTKVAQASWNGDKLDGTGSSGITLDITKAQIMWMDIEWLGVGSVRMGFIINGQFIVCHTFHHANIIDSTYITTASLPLRYEIKNTTATSGNSTLKQICSTVISEGGYELRGLQQAIGTPITTPRNLATAGTFYPIVSLKLKTSALDAIVILTALSIMPVESGNFNWQVRASGDTTGGTWLSAGDNSAVEYNITGTAYTGGRILASGFVKSTNSIGPTIDILKEALFKFQLERNALTGTPFELSLVLASDLSNREVYGSMDWEEISR